MGYVLQRLLRYDAHFGDLLVDDVPVSECPRGGHVGVRKWSGSLGLCESVFEFGDGQHDSSQFGVTRMDHVTVVRKLV